MSAGEFDTKVVIVTGAASGLGRATAFAFAAEGARLVLADVDVAGLGATSAKVKEMGGQAITVATDLSDAAACSALNDVSRVSGCGAVSSAPTALPCSCRI